MSDPAATLAPFARLIAIDVTQRLQKFHIEPQMPVFPSAQGLSRRDWFAPNCVAHRFHYQGADR